VGHKHTKAEILEGALTAAFDEGLSQLTFGRLAKRLDISDRIVVYYFPTKNDLISEVVVAMGLQLQTTLTTAFAEPAADHLDLVTKAWPMVATPEADAIFALFFEANGLAVSGREPYASLVPALVEMWIDWAAGFIDGTSDARRVEAEAAIALIDGLLLLRQLGGAERAARAARRLGIR
jgi:AcrR family transcriptional regulator